MGGIDVLSYEHNWKKCFYEDKEEVKKYLRMGNVKPSTMLKPDWIFICFYNLNTKLSTQVAESVRLMAVWKSIYLFTCCRPSM